MRSRESNRRHAAAEQWPVGVKRRSLGSSVQTRQCPSTCWEMQIFPDLEVKSFQMASQWKDLTLGRTPNGFDSMPNRPSKVHSVDMGPIDVEQERSQMSEASPWWSTRTATITTSTRTVGDGIVDGVTSGRQLTSTVERTMEVNANNTPWLA